MNLRFKNNYDFITLFEKRLSEFTGAPYVVLTDCCTNSIFLSFQYFKENGIIPKEINIPKYTYISVPQIITFMGYKINFTDEKWKRGYNMGLNIFDYAVGFKKNMYIPGEMQCLSFQQKKILPIGRGGAILLDDENIYKVLKSMSYDGRSDPSVHYSKDNISSGYHMYMTPDNAAKGVLLLNQLDDKTIMEKQGSYLDYIDVTKTQLFKGNK